jgi:hypothetical protein
MKFIEWDDRDDGDGGDDEDNGDDRDVGRSVIKLMECDKVEEG